MISGGFDMQAIEFGATSQDGRMRLPDGVPPDARLKVVVMWETTAPADADAKELLASTVEGLTDEDLARPRDLGRPDPQWPSWPTSGPNCRGVSAVIPALPVGTAALKRAICFDRNDASASLCIPRRSKRYAERPPAQCADPGRSSGPSRVAPLLWSDDH
jgi:hypothetical protein